jgi:hypothetical protein
VWPNSPVLHAPTGHFCLPQQATAACPNSPLLHAPTVHCCLPQQSTAACPNSPLLHAPTVHYCMPQQSTAACPNSPLSTHRTFPLSRRCTQPLPTLTRRTNGHCLGTFRAAHVMFPSVLMNAMPDSTPSASCFVYVFCLVYISYPILCRW